MANGRDHQTVMAFETYLKSIPKKIEIGYCVVMGLQM